MRHKKKRLQMNRFTSWHKATVNSMIRSLLIYESIKTTLNKAKSIRPHAEKLIDMAKESTLANKRAAFKILQDHKLVNLLFSDIAPRFSGKKGGYLRIFHLGSRRGDNADLAVLELTSMKEKIKKVKKDKQKEERSPVKEERDAQATGDSAATQEKSGAKETKTETTVKEKHPDIKKPEKKFFSGIKKIFKKERDSL